jgi:hypothetical protein
MRLGRLCDRRASCNSQRQRSTHSKRGSNCARIFSGQAVPGSGVGFGIMFPPPSYRQGSLVGSRQSSPYMLTFDVYFNDTPVATRD